METSVVPESHIICRHLTLAVVLDLGRIIKDSVAKQGMLAWQYNTIGVSDAITMGGEGKSTFTLRRVVHLVDD